MARLALVLSLVPAAAGAQTRARVEIEAGSEVDTNPHRVDEAAPGDPEPAAAARLGMRLDLTARPADAHALRLNLVGAFKKFSPNDDADEEDVAVLSGDVRYDARLLGRPLLLGGRVSYYEAFEEDTIVETRSVDSDFRTGDAALVITLVSEQEHRVIAMGGLRLYQYKPDPRFDFYGEFASLAYAHAFQLGDPDADEPRSIDFSVQYAVQRRNYDSSSYTNVCPDYQQAADPSLCLFITTSRRIDLFHAAVVEALYSGSRLYGARYELHVNDSTSFGESLVRHRLELSATTELFADFFLTGRVLLQLNQFLDPALREGDTGTFITVEDESRNNVLLHLTREIGKAWTIEARYSFFANAFSEQDVPYRRHTAYAGLIYGFQTGP